MLVAVCQTNQIYKCVRCTKLITDNIVLNEMSVDFSLLELKLFMLFTGKFWVNHSSSLNRQLISNTLANPSTKTVKFLVSNHF